MSKIEKFIREYPVRSYECDRDGQLRLITLLNIFQDVADSHANQMGLGYDFCQTKGLAWVGSNYHIGIDRLPRWHETIKVITWPCEERRLGAIRDFRVEDETGHPIIVAASQWILIDFAKKRPVGLRENLPDYQVIPERALETDFAKLPQPEKEDTTTEFKVRYDDIDVNNHVNNSVYPLWASESVDPAFRLEHVPQELEIAFKKEGHYGERVKIITEIQENVSLHDITALSDGRELAKVRIKWQKRS